MEDAASVVQLANKINEQSSNKVDLDEVCCDFPMYCLLELNVCEQSCSCYPNAQALQLYPLLLCALGVIARAPVQALLLSEFCINKHWSANSSSSALLALLNSVYCWVSQVV